MAMDWQTLLCKERPRPSTNPGDHRVEFERDLDRSVFSTPVKRLQDKAQVFPLEPNDAVRTRLTHSMEVSAVARGLATKVGKWLLDTGKIKTGDDRCIEAIAAVCGLIHDLGNPPFGHSGEDAIREWFATRFGENGLGGEFGENSQLVQDFLKFEGNAQSLRLVSKLQILADFNGLNLTYGTLSASCKYTASSHTTVSNGDHAKSKPGYFASEGRLVDSIREKTGTGDARNPLTFLVEAADDIVYSVADIEDAVKKDILSWKDVQKSILQCDAMQEYGLNSGMMKSKLLDPKERVVIQAFKGTKRILKAGQCDMPKDVPNDAYASAFRTSVIGILVNASVKAFQDQYESIMSGSYKGELVEEGDAMTLVHRLKTLARTRVYCTPSNLKLELMGRRVIFDLMDLFWEGAKQLPIQGDPKPKTFPGKLGALLSDNYRRVFQHSVRTMPELPENYHRFQLVTDYVCGMTDTFAKRLHAELTNG